MILQVYAERRNVEKKRLTFSPPFFQSVPIPFPEVQAAVDAQLAFAAANPEPGMLQILLVKFSTHLLTLE